MRPWPRRRGATWGYGAASPRWNATACASTAPSSPRLWPSVADVPSPEEMHAEYLRRHTMGATFDARTDELAIEITEAAEYVPCPTLGCTLPAEVVAMPDDVLAHSRCAADHDVSLAPAVLAHLRGSEAAS